MQSLSQGFDRNAARFRSNSRAPTTANPLFAPSLRLPETTSVVSSQATSPAAASASGTSNGSLVASSLPLSSRSSQYGSNTDAAPVARLTFEERMLEELKRHNDASLKMQRETSEWLKKIRDELKRLTDNYTSAMERSFTIETSPFKVTYGCRDEYGIIGAQFIG